tara:strand:- start:3536 stop:3721 length:186 start_codon:yes stop_codon:yes gene_type:complete
LFSSKRLIKKIEIIGEISRLPGLENQIHIKRLKIKEKVSAFKRRFSIRDLTKVAIIVEKKK